MNDWILADWILLAAFLLCLLNNVRLVVENARLRRTITRILESSKE